MTALLCPAGLPKRLREGVPSSRVALKCRRQTRVLWKYENPAVKFPECLFRHYLFWFDEYQLFHKCEISAGGFRDHLVRAYEEPTFALGVRPREKGEMIYRLSFGHSCSPIVAALEPHQHRLCRRKRQ